MHFRMKYAVFFRFFDDWHIMNNLLTETSGKQDVLWPSNVDVSSKVSCPQNFPLVSVNKC